MFGLNLMLLPIIAGYLVILGIALHIAKNEDRHFVTASVTAIYMVCFICWASFGLAYIGYYLVGLALSIGVYHFGKTSNLDRKLSYAGMILIFMSCCYFLTPYLHYCRYLAILVEMVAASHLFIVTLKRRGSKLQ